MPDHVISLELFDLLDEYVAELESKAQVGKEIRGFDEKSKRRVARQRAARKDLSPRPGP
jgi:hypothetical protein